MDSPEASSLVAEEALPGESRPVVRWFLRRSRRRAAPHEPVAAGVLNEEVAASLLYGARSGAVSVSPSRPPV